MGLSRPAKEPHSTPRPISDNHLTFWLAIVRAKDVWAIGIPWDFSEVNIPICTNITLRHQLNEEKTVYVSMMGGGGKSAMKEGCNHWIPSPPQWSSPPPSPLTCMTPDCKVLQGQPSIWEKVEHLLLNESGNLQPKPIVFDFIVVYCYIITIQKTCVQRPIYLV